jgi:hypothetical protein
VHREKWPLDYFREWRGAVGKEAKDKIALSVPEKFRPMFKDYVDDAKWRAKFQKTEEDYGNSDDS